MSLQHLVPFVQSAPQMRTECRQLTQAVFNIGKFLFSQETHFRAGSSATIAFFEEARQFFKTKANRERGTDRGNPLNGTWRKIPVTVRRTHRTFQQTQAVIVTDGVRTYAAKRRQIATVERLFFLIDGPMQQRHM